MIQKLHFAIFGNNISVKTHIVKNLIRGQFLPEFQQLSGKKGAVFSTHTLQKYINEEIKHDNFALSENANRSILTYSSGEQRKALLEYLISKKPGFLVLDNVFDMIDSDSQKELKQRLTQLSEKIIIVQIVKRMNALLPFIKQGILIDNNKIVYAGKIAMCQQHLQNSRSNIDHQPLPHPISPKIQLTDPLVKFKNISVKYGEKKIVSHINWTIKKGDFWQLKGPNGSGKTTLLTMITGDNPKAYGQELYLFGRKRGSGESIWDIKQKIGYVTPSMTNLFRGWNTVEKMIISGLEDSIGLYKKPTDLQRSIADEWIELIGLSAEKQTRFSKLNEGRQCLVLIARSMIKHPPLLILDEPSHGLDDQSAKLLTKLVNKIAAEGTTTIIYVSHRYEPGLEPRQVFELFPSEKGSVGRII